MLMATPSFSSICEGESIQIQSSGAANYTWTPTIGLSDPNMPNPIASPQVTTVYTVTATNMNGNCALSQSITIEVNDVANEIFAGSDQTVCVGEAVQLSVSGGMNYEWSPAAFLNDPNSSNPIATVTQTTTFTVTSFNPNAPECNVMDQVTVFVEDPVNLTASAGSTQICSGESVQMTASGAANYSWTPSTGLSDPFSSNPIASPTVTTTYMVTGSNANGNCSQTQMVTIIVGESINAMASGSQTICAGETAQLSASGGSNYSWSPTTGLSDPSSPNPIASPTSTTTYVVTVYNSDLNCADQVSVTIIVEPAVNLSVSPGAEICSGESVQMFANGAANYTWTPATGLNNPNSANPIASPSVSTTYMVTGSAASGNCSVSEFVTITVNQSTTTFTGPDQQVEQTMFGSLQLA